ncbi:uncharacterized protein LOC111099217 isoform X2 [Crassostrea virginica]
MAKFVFLILLATISFSLQTKGMENSTCVKSMKTKETIYVRRICKTTTRLSFFFVFRKTVYRWCTKSMTSYKIERFNECCPGYLNISGKCEKVPCPVSHYGNDCSLSCPCETDQYERCDDNGTCLCSPGWTGNNCSQACEQGKYGEGCKYKCTCQNNATCDHVTGICDCSQVVGKTGDNCDKDCPSQFYGLNCSSSCNCSKFQNPVCNSYSGNCTCESGKTGHNCSEDCRNNTFGPDCAKSCECVAENSLSCNSSSGVCDCKAGWIGRSCKIRCDPYHFGKRCEENCSCESTEACDNINGTCFSANVCLAKNTLNCLPSLNLTCQQVSENCNQTDVQKPSLTNDMQDICCKDSVNLMDSICITQDKCDCKIDFGGFACNATFAEVFDKASSPDGMSGSSIAGIVVAVLILIGVVIAVAVFRCRKPSTTRKGASNPGYGTQNLEDSLPIAKSSLENQDYDTTRKDRRQDQAQSEMYDLNTHDDNNYGYDVSTHSKNKVKEDHVENYATTAFTEEYDHLQRNDVSKVEEADYSYSHPPVFSDSSEYSTAGMRVIQTDADNDFTDTPGTQDDNMYSNTTNN